MSPAPPASMDTYLILHRQDSRQVGVIKRMQLHVCVQASTKARSIVRQMEDGKVAGKDYTFEALAELRQVSSSSRVLSCSAQ